MTRLRTILIGILLVLSGSALTLLVQHQFVRHPEPASPAAVHAALLAQMDSTLRLTPAQRNSIHAIFMRHQSLVDSVWGSMNHRMQATMDSVHREMVRVLEPSQLGALHEWIGRQRAGRETTH